MGQANKFYRGVGSKHTSDLFFIFGVVLASTATVVFAIQQLTRPEFWGSQMLAAMFTSGLASLAAIFQLAKLRFSTVDIFSSEILARLRILSSDHSIGRLRRYADPGFVEKRTRNSQTGSFPGESVIELSQEEQFETFYRRSSDLGALSSIIVDHVTDFYSFQKATRDAIRDLAATAEFYPDDTAEIRERIIDVLFLADLMAYSGLRALEELIETPAHRLHARQIALSVGTSALQFVLEEMDSNDHRYTEILHRKQKYTALTSELKSALKPAFLKKGVVAKGIIPHDQEYF